MILIAPYAKKMRNNERHPKDYPWWREVVDQLLRDGQHVVQVGTPGEPPLVSDVRQGLSLPELERLVRDCKTWVSVDSFLQHFCWDLKKPGVCIFGQSDPLIFGHPENVNLLKDRKYLRDKQFWMWEQAEARDDAFVGPDEVVAAVRRFY